MGAFFLAAAVWLVLRDDPPPDETVLLTEPPSTEPGPRSESVVGALIEIAAALPEARDWPEIDREPPETWVASAYERIYGRRRDAELLEQMRRYFEEEASALDRVEAAISREDMGWSLTSALRDLVPGDDAIDAVIDQLEDRARWHRARGDAAAASRDLELGVRLGERFVADGVECTGQLEFAAGHLRRSIDQLDSILRDGGIDPDVEARILGRTPASVREPRVARRCLEDVYRAWREYVDGIGRSESRMGRRSSFASLPSLAFKPNRTLARLGEVLGAVSAEADRPPPEREFPPEVPLEYEGIRLRILLNLNSGEYLLVAFSSQLRNVFDHLDWLRLEENALRLHIALRRYERLHGALPVDLEALLAAVPELSSLPRDPFSGKPFRYDPAVRIFWSVGPNGVDDGAPGWAEFDGTGIPPIQKSPPDRVWWLPPAPMPTGAPSR